MRLRHIVCLPGAYARLSLANKRPRFRLERLERLDWNRLDDRIVLFLLVLEFVRVCERPPERFHSRIVIFVTHGRAFAATYSTRIQNGSPFSRSHWAIETNARLARFPCIVGDNTPITFKRATQAMPRRWAVLHGSQADESESLPRG